MYITPRVHQERSATSCNPPDFSTHLAMASQRKRNLWPSMRLWESPAAYEPIHRSNSELSVLLIEVVSLELRCAMASSTVREPTRDPVDGSVTQQVKDQKYPVIGAGTGVFSFVHVEDAAKATVAALEAEPGVYNVVDDDPCPMADWLPAFARWLGAPAPPCISEEEARRTAGDDDLYYALRLRGASNARAKRQLGFAPRKLQWLE